MRQARQSSTPRGSRATSIRLLGLSEVRSSPPLSLAPSPRTPPGAVTPKLRAGLVVSAWIFPSSPGLWERCDVSEEEEETNWPGSSSSNSNSSSSNSSRHLRGGSEFVSITSKKASVESRRYES